MKQYQLWERAGVCLAVLIDQGMMVGVSEPLAERPADVTGLVYRPILPRTPRLTDPRWGVTHLFDGTVARGY